jgi:undecaprenyl diphosphate synthase
LNFSPDGHSSTDLDPDKIPSHVALIMDGNGRWARQRLLNRVQGHEKGAETVRTIVRTCREIGLAHVTLYAFSTENWQRPKVEVQALMKLLERFLETEQRELMENDIRLNAIGDIERLTAGARAALSRVMYLTADKKAMTLHLALSYGGRSEIVRMVQALAQKARREEIVPDDITEDLVARHLYTAGIPDPDLLIRTSGEMRISNFLLWQIAYAEIYVTPTLWPDFSREEFLKIIKNYQQRERRFGKIDVSRSGLTSTV